MKTRFDLIVLVQSYPNLINTVNFALKYGDGDILILVNGERKIYTFLRDTLHKPNITIRLFGHNIFLRSRLFSWLLPLYVCYLYFRIPTYYSTDKLLTYGNWCDIGAIFHFKTQGDRLINLIAFEEKRYLIKSGGFERLPLFIKILNFLTRDLVERKYYFYEQDGKTKVIPKDSFGLVPLDPRIEVVHASREKSYDLIDYRFKDSKTPFVLLVEKNLIKSKALSYYDFIRLNLALYRFGKNNNVSICVKFKPRDRFFFRTFLYRIFGFSILPSSAPAQLFAVHSNCKCLLGFSSSSMAEDYGKPVYCFGSMKDLFSHRVEGNIKSLRQRSFGNKSVFFLDTIRELENLVL